MRTGGVSNKSLASIMQKSKEDYQAIKSNKIGGLFTLLAKNIRKLPQFVKARFHNNNASNHNL
jgi:hypothetical protein